MTPEEYVELTERTESLFFPELTRYEARVLHVGMGLVTEAGEFMDALKKRLFYNKPLDFVNLDEEAGDILWYIARYCDVRGVSLSALMEQNIKKLQKRYPEKFTTECALHRDLEGEREVLEE